MLLLLLHGLLFPVCRYASLGGLSLFRGNTKAILRLQGQRGPHVISVVCLYSTDTMLA